MTHNKKSSTPYEVMLEKRMHKNKETLNAQKQSNSKHHSQVKKYNQNAKKKPTA